MPACLELRDLRKEYDGREIIKGVSLKIAPSEFVVLVGSSGCGKSTLLRMIAGLEEITSGELYFDDQRVTDWSPARRRIGMVFQSYALYPHMTVAENIGFGLKLARKSRVEREKRVNEALRVLQLEELRDRRPAQLSGGQRQRVAIGRAIVRKPNAFLFDEPLSNLDAGLRVQMRMEIGRLHQQLKNTVVYVTHDQVEAMTLADRIVVLEGGLIRQAGAPLDLYERPANRFVAGFIGTPKMGFLDVEPVSESTGGATVSVMAAGQSKRRIVVPFRLSGPQAMEAFTLGVRPEHCTLCATDDAVLSGTVVMLERLGAETFAFVDVPGAEDVLAVRLPANGVTLAHGELVGLSFDPAKAHLFDPSGQACQRLAP